MAEKSEVGALDHSIFNYGLEIWDGGYKKVEVLMPFKIVNLHF